MQIISSIFDWISRELLKMEWLNKLIAGLLEKVFNISLNEWYGKSIHFFIYDTIKIFILLSVLIFIVSYIQSFFPPERTKVILGRFKGIWGNILGALLGTLTPFCSCSSIPLFIGFTSAGLPLGITFSFLISSPLVDLASFMVLMSIPEFGWEIALAYVVVGLILAVLGGTIIDKLKMEKYVQSYVFDIKKDQENAAKNIDLEVFKLTRIERVKYALEQVKFIVKKVWLFILIGVSIGALIHELFPENLMYYVLGRGNPLAVVVAAIIGVPMYADIFGTIPIAEVLYGKGVQIGTILTFMMGVTALSIPSIVMLSKVIKPKLLTIYVSIVTIGIIVIGFFFNAFDYIFMGG